MDKKYNYNGITTETDRQLVCSATFDMKNYADTAFLLLEDILSSHFSALPSDLKPNSAQLYCFIANYGMINAKIRAALDYVDQICTILDFLHGDKTHRTDYLPDTLKNLMNFLTT